MREAKVYDELKDVVHQKDALGFSYAQLYHLSPLRRNLIDWLPLTKDMHVLEWNAECGALTGSLLKKAGKVTAVTETEKEAELIRKRFAGCGALNVLIKEVFEKEALKNEENYDRILLIGHFSRERERLGSFRKMLPADGSLIVSDGNRLGLKYFAGNQEDYQGGYFTGIENYPDGGTGERQFTAKEYEGFLREAGFTDFFWYYPYPDHKFPTDIYSEEWLPHPGELNDNRRNFDRDRYLFFDEEKAFDTLLSEGIFHSFSNSFLIEAKKEAKDCLPRVVYSRFSNERKDEFQIRTDIVQENTGEKRVVKYALRPEGIPHIRRLKAAEKALNACYTGDKIDFCACKETEMSVSFPFVRGAALQDILEEAYKAGREERISEILNSYIRRLSADGGETPFVMTDGFLEVFGDVSFAGEPACPAYCDIDMIFSNILVEDGWEKRRAEDFVWHVIDYEWSFSFPIPKAFVIYRAFYFAYDQIFAGSDYTLERLTEMAGIEEEQRQTFQKMEEHFQQYIRSGGLPVRNMQRKMGTKIRRLDEVSVPRIRFFAGKLAYHIDREECQDGCVIVSGWALGRTFGRRAYPVKILARGADGKPIEAEITRTKREDVFRNLNLREAMHASVGFECVFPVPEKGFAIVFAIGGLRRYYVGRKR